MGVDTGLEICGKFGTLPTLRPDLDKKTYYLDAEHTYRSIKYVDNGAQPVAPENMAEN